MNLIGSNWSSFPSESVSPIPPGQRTKPESSSPSPWKIQQKNLEDYEKDRVGKYADYFKGNEILPIPEFLQKNEPRIVSLVVTDLKSRRLVGLKKEGFKICYGKRAAHANTSAERVSRHGTSCSLPVTKRQNSSDCRRNIQGLVLFGSLSVTSRRL